MPSAWARLSAPTMASPLIGDRAAAAAHRVRSARRSISNRVGSSAGNGGFADCDGVTGVDEVLGMAAEA